MEKNIVVIDLYKYDELIKEIENKKNKVKELEKEIEKQISERKLVNSTIYSKIYKDMDWHLKQIVKDEEDDYGYYHNLLRDKFKEYGYDDENYINECIKCMINDTKNENMVRDAEELEKESEE